MDNNQTPENESMPSNAVDHAPEDDIKQEAKKDNPEAQLQPRPRPGAVSVSISHSHPMSLAQPQRGFWDRLIDGIKDFLGNE